jgi:Domain of unknown function (DUF4055)
MIDPSKVSTQYQDMAAKWMLPHALMGGTAAMQQYGTRFLPRHPAENETVYQARRKRTVLRNYFRKNVTQIVGQIFQNGIAPSKEMPLPILDILKNMDLMGRGLNTFARDWFQDALVSGISYVLVDFPNSSPGDPVQTDERPYAVQVNADQVISVQWDENGARPHLKQVRLKETFQGRDESSGFGQHQIRSLTPDGWEIFRQDDQRKWNRVDAGECTLGEIPLVPLYTNRTGFMQASPPLEDLAYLNLEHFQIRSDQRNALNVASFPILAASGYDPEIDGPIEVGPNKVLTTSDIGGKYYYVESSGAALEAGARELADLEKAIEQFGLQFETPVPGESATGRMLDAVAASASLSSMQTELEESLNMMLRLFGKWTGVSDFGSVTIPKRSNLTAAMPAKKEDLLSLYEAGVLNEEELRQEIIERGVVTDGASLNHASSD